MDAGPILSALVARARQEYAAAAERLAYTRGYLDALLAFDAEVAAAQEPAHAPPDPGPAAGPGSPDADGGAAPAA